MNGHAHSRRVKVGLPPGTLLPTGEPRVERTTLTLLEYNAQRVEERVLPDAEACRALTDASAVHWLNIEGLHDTDVIQRVGDIFGLHPLVLEDIVTSGQRPRMEDYGDYVFIVVKMLYRNDTDRQIVTEQLSIILGPFGVLTFQEVPGDVFDPIRERIRAAKGRVRGAGPDYLAYRLLDAVIDNYFIILEDVNDRVESIQDRVADKPEHAIIHDIHQLKRDMIFLRKSLWPVREVVGGLQKCDSALVAPSTEIFLRDAYEHTIQVIDMIETMRDTLASALDIYLSSMSNHMNEIMRVLTVMSTFFIPLTFIVGIYGMNFKHMPELEWRLGYAGVWAVMLATTIGLLVFFRRKKWL
jgi:magnesium transporter